MLRTALRRRRKKRRKTRDALLKCYASHRIKYREKSAEKNTKHYLATSIIDLFGYFLRIISNIIKKIKAVIKSIYKRTC